MNLQFWGATEGVTGSLTVVELPGGKIIVDCGLVQGEKDASKKNHKGFPFEPKEIKAVILTHAHLDHCGLLPKLVKDGFRGSIYCTKATKELALIILSDSAKLQEDDDVPLYTAEDVGRVRSVFKIKEIGQGFKVAGATLKFQGAGHILGAVSVIIDADKRIVFSGDLGRRDDFLMFSPTFCPPSDCVVMESTYGSRVRLGHLEEELKKLLSNSYKKHQVVIVASFAVARAQLLLTLIHEFYERNPQYKMDVFIDSPMMKKANQVYKKYSDLTNHPEDLYEAIDEVNVVQHKGQWDSIKKKKGPFIVITSSGMVSGGRIWRYLSNWQSDANAVLFLPGYQAVGTSGRFLAEGGREITDNEGNVIKWSGEVIHSDAFSSHADQTELTDWVTSNSKDTHVFLVHGDEESKKKLKEKLLQLGVREVTIPHHNQSIDLNNREGNDE
jgi:metallo-beta-lactamase family protein